MMKQKRNEKIYQQKLVPTLEVGATMMQGQPMPLDEQAQAKHKHRNMHNNFQRRIREWCKAPQVTMPDNETKMKAGSKQQNWSNFIPTGLPLPPVQNLISRAVSPENLPHIWIFGSGWGKGGGQSVSFSFFFSPGFIFLFFLKKTKPLLVDPISSRMIG